MQGWSSLEKFLVLLVHGKSKKLECSGRTKIQTVLQRNGSRLQTMSFLDLFFSQGSSFLESASILSLFSHALTTKTL